jgi:hypothetical protein
MERSVRPGATTSPGSTARGTVAGGAHGEIALRRFGLALHRAGFVRVGARGCARCERLTFLSL